MNPQPGEVWLADLGLAAKPRPVVVVSRYDPDPPRALITYVPLITQNRQSPYEVMLSKLRFLDRDSGDVQHQARMGSGGAGPRHFPDSISSPPGYAGSR